MPPSVRRTACSSWSGTRDSPRYDEYRRCRKLAGEGSMARVSPSDQQLCEWFDSLSNWGRWGADDLMGTLNLITPEKRRQAYALATEGLAVSCAHAIRFNEHNLDDAWPEPRHYMNSIPPHAVDPNFVGMAGSSDIAVLNLHGLTLTHLDCPGHYFFKPAKNRPLAGYNGLEPT